MIYMSFPFYLFLAASLLLYYIFPIKMRWLLLLTADLLFYLLFCKAGWQILFITVFVSYAAAFLLPKCQGKGKKLLFAGTVIALILPWLLSRNGGLIRDAVWGEELHRLIVPLGISFYTMQIIAYLADVYRGDISPQRNLAKYALFITFFPQILQGPIPRYSQLSQQLFEGHIFDEERCTRGFYLIIWGFFLKLVIADKAGVIVDAVFENYPAYSGGYLWVASVLYSIQLYTDFLSCTTLAQGVSLLFGIELAKNFERPYFAQSVKEFWRRWHISLSNWLRDYVYIPLGGNRKGSGRKYLNLTLTFLVSGVWHGAGLTYLLWSGIHGLYQIVGEQLEVPKEKGDSKWTKRLKQAGTFLLVNFAWVIFRADTVRTGLGMIAHMLSIWNPWIFFNDRIFSLGLGWKEMMVLFCAAALLYGVEKKQEEGIVISSCIMKQKLPVRWMVCMTGICAIVVLGTYGYGFDVQDFIYGRF